MVLSFNIRREYDKSKISYLSFWTSIYFTPTKISEKERYHVRIVQFNLLNALFVIKQSIGIPLENLVMEHWNLLQLVPQRFLLPIFHLKYWQSMEFNVRQTWPKESTSSITQATEKTPKPAVKEIFQATKKSEIKWTSQKTINIHQLFF